MRSLVPNGKVRCAAIVGLCISNGFPFAMGRPWNCLPYQLAFVVKGSAAFAFAEMAKNRQQAAINFFFKT